MRRVTTVVMLVCAATVVMTGLATAKGPHKCSGNATAPGVLASGTYKSGVVVQGVCFVNAGPVKVIGLLKVTDGSALVAQFAHNNSSLTVKGDLLVQHRGAAFLGCGTPEVKCIDDPTLTSKDRVTGNLTASAPLGLLVHLVTILGNVTETGGGGGFSCVPPATGPFALAMAPVYSDIEDSTVKGNVSITGLRTCWLGLARVHIKGNVTLKNNKLGDDDGIEVIGNTIAKNLVCRSNGHPSPMMPGTQPVWDSHEAVPMSPSIYPRIADPDTVKGQRVGQCNRSTPTTLGGAFGKKKSF